MLAREVVALRAAGGGPEAVFSLYADRVAQELVARGGGQASSGGKRSTGGKKAATSVSFGVLASQPEVAAWCRRGWFRLRDLGPAFAAVKS